jgi:hypothetical protein
MTDRISNHRSDAAKVEALVAVLRDALPRLVRGAVDAFKGELPKLLPNLSNAEWDKLKHDEDRRRGGTR